MRFRVHFACVVTSPMKYVNDLIENKKGIAGDKRCSLRAVCAGRIAREGGHRRPSHGGKKHPIFT